MERSSSERLALHTKASSRRSKREHYLRKKRLQKPKDQKQAARIFRQLARAGFASKTIFTILKKWDVDDEMLTALKNERPSLQNKDAMSAAEHAE